MKDEKTKAEKDTKETTTFKKPVDITKYTAKTFGSGTGGSVSKEVIDALDNFFMQMHAGEVVDNAALVAFLEDQGIAINNSIKTDVPLYAVPKTNAFTDKAIERRKVNTANKMSRWIYEKL